MGSGTIGVTPAVFAEVLRASGLTHDEVNALPFEERARLVSEARIRLTTAPPKVGSDRAAADQLRAEREQRKAAEWAKRNPRR